MASGKRWKDKYFVCWCRLSKHKWTEDLNGKHYNGKYYVKHKVTHFYFIITSHNTIQYIWNNIIIYL